MAVLFTVYSGSTDGKWCTKMGESREHKAYQELRAAIEDEQSKLLTAHESYSEYLAKVHKILQELARGVDHNKTNLETWTVNTRDRLAELDDQLATGLGASDEARAQLDKRDAEAAEHAEAMKASEETRVDLEQRLSDESASAESARGRVAKLESELGKASEDVNAQQVSATEAQEALQQHLDDAANASGELTQLQGAQAALQEEVETLRTQSQSAEEAKEKAVTALIETQSERDRIIEEAKSLVSLEKVESIQRDLEEERTRVRDLEKKLQDEAAKGKQSVLAEQLAVALKDAEDARAQLDAVQQGEPDGAPVAASPERQKQGAARARKKMKGTKANGQKRALGEILVESEIVTEDQLSAALAIQKSNPQRHLGAILIEKGHAAEDVIAEALASQCNVEYVHLDDTTVSSEAALIIEERLAQQHTCIPIQVTGNTLVLALANPMDLLAIEDVERACGRNVDVVVSTETEIKDAIGRYYWEPE